MSSDKATPENTDQPYTSPQPDNDIQYRSISKAAVSCVVFAVIGLLAYMSPVFVIFPMLALFFGIVALKSFSRFPDELLGKNPAKIATIVAGICFITSLALHVYIYNTEVPEGYNRISFADLKPSKKTTKRYSEKADGFNGQNVFLKGYVRPSDRKEKLSKFILVGDFGDCCFGGNPKPTDVVAINIVIDKTVDYSWRLRKIGGQFILNARPRQISEKDIPQVYYEIHADYLK